jgi:hypothetical protein
MALLQKAYLGATPLFRNEDWFAESYDLINESSVVTVTANSSAHTKGAWSQIIASASANASLLILLVKDIQTSTANTATLLDLATGASGSETAFASNIAVGGAVTSTTDGIVFAIPIKIANGTRLSARIQSVVTGGKTASVQAYLFNVGDFSTAPTSVDVIGGNTANSEGISCSGSSGTWVEAIASTSQAYRAVALVPSTHNASVGFANIVQYDVGVGAAGNEVDFGLVKFVTTTQESVRSTPPYLSLFGANIPAGSRLAVRHNTTTQPERIGFTLIAIP